MAQPQSSIPDYPYPDRVSNEWRNAPTPEPGEDLDQDGVLQIDPADTALLKENTDMNPLNSTTQLYSLKNTNFTCYRNSVLHSLFTIDYFLNLLDSGNTVTQNKCRIYKLLHRAGQNFRGKEISEFRGPVREAWKLLTTTDPLGGAEGRYFGLASRKFNANDGGMMEDAGTFYDYLMDRLCETELIGEQRSSPTAGSLYKRVFAHQLVFRQVYNCDCHQKNRLPLDDQLNFPKYLFNVSAPVGEKSLITCISKTMYESANEDLPQPPCPQCSREDATPIGFFKKFYYLPEVLTVNLTFIDGSRGEFKKGCVDIPETLDLSNLCDREADKDLSKYKLQAAILWTGVELEDGSTMGHYISYVRRGAKNNWVLLDDNIDIFNPSVTARMNGRQSIKSVKFKDIAAVLGPATENKFRPKLLLYIRDRQPPSSQPPSSQPPSSQPPSSQPPSSQPENPSDNDDERRQRADAARETRDGEAVARLAEQRASRKGKAETDSNLRVDVNFKPTRYRGATQGAAQQPQGRCNCGGPRAQAGRGAIHQATPPGNGTGGRNSGGGSGERAAMGARRTRSQTAGGSQQGSPSNNENNDEERGEEEEGAQEEEAAEEEEAAAEEDGAPGSSGTGGSNNARNWPRGLEEQPQPPADLDNVTTWNYNKFQDEYRKAFGKNPPGGKPRKNEAVEQDRATNATRLRNHFNLTMRQNWELYSLAMMRQTVEERIKKMKKDGAGNGRSTENPGGNRSQPYVTWLEADDQLVHAARQEGAQSQKSQGKRPEQRNPVQDPLERTGPEDDADEDLVNGIANLEELIRRLEAKSCGCPLNGQASLPVDGVRNGRGTPHRALQVIVKITRSPVEFSVTREYWIPVAPEIDRQGVQLSARVYVNRSSQDPNSQMRTVRIDLSGPEEASEDPDVSFGSGRTTPPDFMNWIEFDVDFHLEAEQVEVAATLDDLPAVPLELSRRPPPIPQRRRETHGGGGGDNGSGGSGGGGSGGGDNGDGGGGGGPSGGGGGGGGGDPPHDDDNNDENHGGGDGGNGQGDQGDTSTGDKTGGGDPPSENPPEKQPETTINPNESSTTTVVEETTTGTATGGTQGAGTQSDPPSNPFSTPSSFDPSELDESTRLYIKECDEIFGSGSAGSGQKRTASVAGIDDDSGTQGGDSSRTRVEDQSFESDFPTSSGFNFGTTEASTPARKALQEFQPSTPDEQLLLEEMASRLRSGGSGQ